MTVQWFEFLKPVITTLASTGFGFSLGYWGDIRRRKRERRDRTRRMKRALYSEMAQLYESVTTITGSIGIGDDVAKELNVIADLLKRLRIDAFEFAKSQPDVFYEIPEAFKLDEIYSTIHVAQVAQTMDSEEVCDFYDYFIDAIERAIAHKSIDADLFKEASPSTFRKIANAIKTGLNLYERRNKGTEQNSDC